MASPESTKRDGDVESILRSLVREAAQGNGVLVGEPTLAAQLGVSRPRLREALARLENEGLVRRRKGTLTVVNRPGVEMAARFDLQFDYSEMLAQGGMRAEMDLLDVEVTERPDDSGLDEGSSVLRTVKRWRADGTPAMVAVDTLLLPPGGLGGVDPTTSVFDLVELLWGEPLEWEVATPGACLLVDPFAGWLDCTTGAPALTLDLLGVSASGRRLFAAAEHHVPSMVRYGFIRTVRRRTAGEKLADSRP